MTKHIGILGGTFDPIHNGHIACATFVLQHCQLDEVRLMPCHMPPHRATPGVSSDMRTNMAQLAIEDNLGLSLELIELNQDVPSYTFDTLQKLTQREPNSCFYFIIGMDSLCYFTKWKNWQGILALAHLIVCQRPNYSEQQGDAPALLTTYGIKDISQLQDKTAGGILLLDNPLIDISATNVRKQLHNKEIVNTLSPKVLNYIKQHQLYQD